jgi:hypothetical protein
MSVPETKGLSRNESRLPYLEENVSWRLGALLRISSFLQPEKDEKEKKEKE